MTSPPKRKVIVIGGGYAGASVAKALDPHAVVTLVEPRTAFANNVAALRSVVHPDFAPNMFFAYDNLLAVGTIVHERAVEVEPGRVVLESGTVVEGDVTVLATGSTYPYPAKPRARDAAAALAEMRSTHDELARSTRVLLVGAGAVGVELAAEVKLAWPDKTVILLDGADTVLSGNTVSDRLRDDLQRQLEGLGVELRLGCALAELPTIPPACRGCVDAVTDDGEPVDADIWFRCFGVEPASEILGPSLAGARLADGSIAVDDRFRVLGRPDVYALGDVSNADSKMAGLAMIQARVVASNVKAILRGEQPARHYQPAGTMIMVAIGPDGGAGESPAGFHDGAEVSAMKSGDLLTGFFRDLFGSAGPATLASDWTLASD